MKQSVLLFFLALLPLTTGAVSSWGYGNGNIKCVLDGETLTITGNGAMFDFDRNNTPPWLKYNIKTVIIESGVTSIGNYSFFGCTSVTSISISESVTSIGEHAFYGCSSLASISSLDNITSIGEYAFTDTPWYNDWYNDKPDGIVYLGKVAYRYKGAMPENTKIVIENGTTEIGFMAFSQCKNLTSIVIPNSVTSIAKEAFSYCSNLTSVNIPQNVTSIGDQAFYNCKSLTSVTILFSPTYVGNDIFKLCTNIKEVTFESEIVTKIFKGLSSIEKVTIKDNVTSIDSQAFYGCTGLKSLIIGSSVTFIGENAFSDRSDSGKLFKTYWLANTPPTGYNEAKGVINYVSNDNFDIDNKLVYPFLSSCFEVDGVRYVPVSPSERTCDVIDCVYNESATNIVIGQTVSYKGVNMSVKKVQPYFAFKNKYIETVVIDNDGELAHHAFANCYNMKSITLGKKISSIGNSAFEGCASLEAIDIPEAITVLNDYTFSGCSSLKEIIIKPGITDINNSVFFECKSLSKVIISDSETDLNMSSNRLYYVGYNHALFSSCPLDSVYIGRDIIYNTTEEFGYSPFYRNTSLRAVKITDKEKVISANEFYGCTNLQRVIIGDGVTDIGDWAFSGCSSLKYFAFGTQVQSIGKEAFSDCTSVVEIISKASAPPTCGIQALDDINKWECKLYVPDGCLATYQAADQWKDFFFSEEGEGTINQGDEKQDNGKCEAPTISLKGGKLLFESKTNGVIFHYSITHSDVKSDITNGEVGLTNTYNISVYASKENYENSDVVNAQIEVKGGGDGDVNGDGVVNAADVVKVTSIIMGAE